MENFDVVVIGGGPGGYPAAIRAAQLGARTALVEKEWLGGTCLNAGCIPSKALISAAEAFARVAHLQNFGVKAGAAAFDYAAILKRKNDVVTRLQGGVRQLLQGNGVTVFPGTAAFESRRRITVTGSAAPTTIEAKSFIIATGAVSAVPGFLPKHPRVMESRGFLCNQQTLPATAIVLGGGIIGSELACLLANLGVKVTIVELIDEILTGLDTDVRQEAHKIMEKSLGIRILTGKPLEGIVADDKGVRGKRDGETIEAEILLAALGRKPATAGLGLETIGVKTNPQGTIPIDEFGRTAAANVYAIGDITEGPQLAHRATAQGIVAAEHACGRTRRNEYVVPACVFTHPEIGSVGLGEQEAALKGRKVRIGKFPFSSLGKAMASGETYGFAKLIVDADTDQILGAQVVGPHATELITPAALAVRAELTAKDMGHTIHSHPTMSEVWMEAAHAVHGEAIHAAPKRKPAAVAAK